MIHLVINTLFRGALRLAFNNELGFRPVNRLKKENYSVHLKIKIALKI